MSAEYPGAGWVACPGFGYNPAGSHGRCGYTAKWIILHGTASGDGTAEQQAQYFSTATDHGVHFVIGKDGTVIQLVALADAAYGNGWPTATELQQHAYADFWDSVMESCWNLNLVTVSIEHCKIASDNSDLLTPAQQDASFKLVAWLCQRLGIPPRQADASGGITGHFSINGIERVNCPGPYPWAELWDYLQPKGTHSGMAIFQHPTDNGRIDIVWINKSNGRVLHAHNKSDGMAGLFTEASGADFGVPSQEPIVEVQAGFNNSGQSIFCIAIGQSGQWYGRSFNTGDESPQNDWTPIARVFSRLPSGSTTPTTPDLAKLLADVQSLAAWLKAAPTL